MLGEKCQVFILEEDLQNLKDLTNLQILQILMTIKTLERGSNIFILWMILKNDHANALFLTQGDCNFRVCGWKP